MNTEQKPVPCGWCQEEPSSFSEPMCETSGCLFAYRYYKSVADWNKTNGRILAQRRKDFEAGHDYAIRYRGKTFSAEHTMFDDYIKGER